MLIVSAVAVIATGCASFNPTPVDDVGFKDRAETQGVAEAEKMADNDLLAEAKKRVTKAFEDAGFEIPGEGRPAPNPSL